MLLLDSYTDASKNIGLVGSLEKEMSYADFLKKTFYPKRYRERMLTKILSNPEGLRKLAKAMIATMVPMPDYKGMFERLMNIGPSKIPPKIENWLVRWRKK